MRDLQARDHKQVPPVLESVQLRVTELRRRVARVRRLLRDWYQLQALDHPDDRADAVKDILTDLRHYCTATGIDFYKAVDNSYGNYLHEQHHLGE